MSSQGQRSGQGSASILAVRESKPDDADNDDDDRDEGNDAADDADDERVHVVGRGLLGLRGFRMSVFRVRRHGGFVAGSGDDVRLGGGGHLLRQELELGRRRRCPTFTGQLFFRKVGEKLPGQHIRGGATNFTQIIVERVQVGLVLKPASKCPRVAVAEDGVGGQALKADVPLLAVQRVQELGAERGQPAATNIERDVRGHGHREEDGRRDVGDVRVLQLDVQSLAGDSGEGADGDVVDVGPTNAQLPQPGRVGRREVVADEGVLELHLDRFDQFKVGQNS